RSTLPSPGKRRVEPRSPTTERAAGLHRRRAVASRPAKSYAEVRKIRPTGAFSRYLTTCSRRVFVSAIPSPRSGTGLIDEYFIENRTRLLEVASYLDRLDRSGGSAVEVDF